MFASLTESSVTCSCDPPPQSSRSSKLIKYTLKYRKQVERDWTFMPETDDCHQTVTQLDDASVYDFTVAAKYDGGDLGPDAEPTAVLTNIGISTVSLTVLVVVVVYVAQLVIASIAYLQQAQPLALALLFLLQPFMTWVFTLTQTYP